MSTATATSAADLLGGSGPVPTSSPTPPPPAAAAPAALDKLGRSFNASKFLADASGAPRLDKLGRFIPQGLGARKGGKKGPSARSDKKTLPMSLTTPDEAPVSQIVTPAAPAAAPVPQGPDKYAVAAGSITAVVQAGLIALGQEEGILSDAEKIAVGEPIEAVLRKYGLGEMPPELGLAVALAAVVAPRMARPKTQTSIQKIRAWCIAKWFEFKGERVARRVAADQQEAPARA